MKSLQMAGQDLPVRILKQVPSVAARQVIPFSVPLLGLIKIGMEDPVKDVKIK